MTTPDSTSTAWSHCPTGEIGRMVADLRRQRRRQFLGRAAAGACVLAGVVWGGTLLSGPGISSAQRLTCDEFHERARSYAGAVDGRENINPDVFQRMEYHLAYCRRCREYFHDEYPQTPMPAEIPHPDRTAATSPDTSDTRWLVVLPESATRQSASR